MPCGYNGPQFILNLSAIKVHRVSSRHRAKAGSALQTLIQLWPDVGPLPLARYPVGWYQQANLYKPSHPIITVLLTYLPIHLGTILHQVPPTTGPRITLITDPNLGFKRDNSDRRRLEEKECGETGACNFCAFHGLSISRFKVDICISLSAVTAPVPRLLQISPYQERGVPRR